MSYLCQNENKEWREKNENNRIIRIMYKITQSDNLKPQNTIQLVDFYLASRLKQFNCLLFMLIYLKSQI